LRIIVRFPHSPHSFPAVGCAAVLPAGALQDAHLLQRQAVLVEDAEHRVAVDDQLREVGDGRG
jgi:hypothetical protein